MNFFLIPAALIVALLLIFILSVVLKKPLRGFGLLFVLLFLVTWGTQLWITPIGPVALGISWIPLTFICLLLVLLVLSVSNTVGKKDKNEKTEGPVIVAGFFFWLILVLLIIAIGIGYYKGPVLIAE